MPLKDFIKTAGKIEVTVKRSKQLNVGVNFNIFHLQTKICKNSWNNSEIMFNNKNCMNCLVRVKF